jgi:hypothetical protein
MIAALLLRDIEAALRASHGDTDAERLERVASVLTRAAILAADRETAGHARMIATDLREMAARLELQ